MIASALLPQAVLNMIAKVLFLPNPLENSNSHLILCFMAWHLTPEFPFPSFLPAPRSVYPFPLTHNPSIPFWSKVVL